MKKKKKKEKKIQRSFVRFFLSDCASQSLSSPFLFLFLSLFLSRLSLFPATMGGSMSSPSASGDGKASTPSKASQLPLASSTSSTSTTAAATTTTNQQPAALVVCGPSGVGKGTLIKRLMEKYPGKFGFSCSHTTRAPREGEQVNN